MTGGQAMRIIDNLEGIVCLVFSTGHDTGTIESLVVKPTTGCKTGLGLQCLEGKLQILRIDPAGLWSHSPLSEGNHILAINGIPCSRMDGATASTLVNTSDTFVTILVRSVQQTNLVVEVHERPSSIHSPLFHQSGSNGCGHDNRPTFSACGPCFQKIWSPAKIAHISVNMMVLIGTPTVCFIFSIGMGRMLFSLCLGLMIVNMPWVGWKKRGDSLCSMGQILSVFIVMIWCVAFFPGFLSGSGNFPMALFQSLCLASPLTFMATLPIYFVDDNIEFYAVSASVENEGAQVGEASTASESIV